MPDLKGVSNLYLIFGFIVPGLVIVYVRSRFITGRAPSNTENIVSYFALSTLYYALTLPISEWALTIQGPPTARVVIWIGNIFLGPALLGLILGAAGQRGWGNWLADKLRLSTVHVIPTAWDWRFSTIPRNGLFLMVTFSSGEQVVGFFGGRSFASSDSGERDLYIEEEYILNEDGSWQARPERVGILIPVKEIKYVEFWDTK
jgi:hypothetical protein